MVSRVFVSFAVSLLLLVGFAVGLAQAAPSYVSGLYLSWGREEGHVLTITPGIWEHTPPLTFSYEWFHEGSTAVIATGTSHTVDSADIGKKLFVIVTATDPTGAASVNSNVVGPFRYRAPVNTVKPTILGEPAVGNSLEGNPGTWVLAGSSKGPISYLYRWYRNGTYVSGGLTYKVTELDAGTQLRFEVRASIPDGAGGTAYRYAYAFADVEAPAPSVTSNIKAGDVLTGTVTWIIEAPPGTKAVEFWKELTQLHVDTAVPFTYQLDTTQYPNGRTHLGMAFTTADDVRHKQQVGYVTIENAPPKDALRSSIAEGAVLTGVVKWTIEAPAGTKSVEFWKDNVHLHTDTTTPFEYELDTRTYPNGEAWLGMAFTDTHDARHKQQVGNVTINNQISAPPSTPPSPAPTEPAGPPDDKAPPPSGGVAGVSVIVGTMKSDRLLGTDAADVIRGRKGNDTILAFAGADRLYGGRGKDVLRGQSGNDKLWGGSSHDRLYGGAGRDFLRGEAGNDKLRGGGGKDTFLGGRGNDKIWARDGVVEVIRGGAGYDVAVVDRNDIVIGCEVVRRAA